MKYESPEIKIFVYEGADDITTSGFDPGKGGIGDGDKM